MSNAKQGSKVIPPRAMVPDCVAVGCLSGAIIVWTPPAVYNKQKGCQKRLDRPELDGPEILENLLKSINEIWTVFKLINNLP